MERRQGTLLAVGGTLWRVALYRRWDREGHDSHTGREVAQQFCPSADLLVLRNAHTAKSDMRVHVYHHVKIAVCVLENACWKGWGVELLCVILNYRACLLFNSSAEELMPQPKSQPSCIIAPVCHCQRLSKATSDCFSPLYPLFAFYH